MRWLGSLGVALALVLAMTAAVGAGSAYGESTVLCLVNEAKCPKESVYSQVLVAELLKEETEEPPPTSMELVLKKYPVVCTKGKLGFLTFKETEGPLVGEMSSPWTFLHCEPSKCEIQVVNEGYPAELEATGGGNGTLTLSVPELVVSCFALVCLYSATPIKFTFEGGNPAFISSEAALSLIAGTNGCGNPATLNSKYIVVGPEEGVYVTHR